MIIIVKQGTKQERVQDLIHWIESQNLRTHVSTGDYSTIIGVIGDTSKLDGDLISGLDIVQGVKRVSEPYKSANRKFHPQDSIIEVGEQKLKVGHGSFALIAGPCSVESEEQIISVAKSVKAAVTHAVLTETAYDRLSENWLDELIVTDSTPPDPRYADYPITVLNIAPLLTEAILRIHNNMSVTSLFKVKGF